MAALLTLSDRILPPGRREMLHEIGLLVLRLAFGLGLITHGAPKLAGFAEMAPNFADPIGLGPQLSLALVVLAEFFAAGAVALGLLTRLATIPVLINMAVAGFVVHGADPWQKKELAVVYLAAYACILLLGPGRLSLDGALRTALERGRDRTES